MSVRCPLTQRERLYLVGRLHLLRGRGVDAAERFSVALVIDRLTGRVDPESGEIRQPTDVDARDLLDLEAATAALERLVRAQRRRGAPDVDDETAVRLLRRLRNAARRTTRPT